MGIWEYYTHVHLKRFGVTPLDPHLILAAPLIFPQIVYGTFLAQMNDNTTSQSKGSANDGF